MKVPLTNITCPHCYAKLDIETADNGRRFLVDRFHFASTCPALFDYVKQYEEPQEEPDWSKF